MKDNDVIVCVSDKELYNGEVVQDSPFTIGKRYTIIKVYDLGYDIVLNIINDYGVDDVVSSSNFITLAEVREEQLNDILNEER